MTTFAFFKLFAGQLAVAAVITLVSFGVSGGEGAFAALLGCGIAFIPNAYFTLQAFRYNAAETPVRALGAMYRGEAGKFILVAVLTALTFKFLEVALPLLLFVSLFFMLLAHPLVSLLVLPSPREEHQMKNGHR